MSEEGGSVAEISIKLSNEEQSFTQKFLCYESVRLHHTDPVLQDYVSQAKDAFKGRPDDCIIKIKYVWE